MGRYRVRQDYRAEIDGEPVGPFARGGVVELDDPIAGWVERDAPGTLLAEQTAAVEPDDDEPDDDEPDDEPDDDEPDDDEPDDEPDDDEPDDDADLGPDAEPIAAARVKHPGRQRRT